ncbi:MAG TPA: ABC transporter substrate-binding protein [Stellaceae bacterium]|nr:ABC transporter substrate-binding protein [Stellaceae bacterium]
MFLIASGLAPHPAAAAETLRVSAIKAAAYGSIFVAIERGYFAARGLDVELSYFEASPPIAVAVVSGDLDIGIGATSAAFFALGDKLRIIGGFARETAGFQGMTFVASNRGWDVGVRSLKDLGGHSVAIGTIGSAPHYSLALIEEKYHIDPESVRLLALQTVSNQVSALIGGEADAGVTISTGLMPAIAKNEVKLLGFVGDEVPWQLSSIFTATRTADERRDTIARFLEAYRQGAHEYVDAFAGPDGKRHDGPTAPAILDIIAKYVGQTPDELKTAIGYVDPDARVDVKDLQRQVDWYKSQGMLKGDIDAAAVLDWRFVVALP